MSGAWAREADNAREHMLGRTDLAAAAWYLWPCATVRALRGKS